MTVKGKQSAWDFLRYTSATQLVLLLTCIVALSFLLVLPADSGSPITFVSSEEQDQNRQADALHQQALVLLKKGDYREALAPAQKAVQLRESLFGADHPNVAETLNTLGLVYHNLGEIDQARSVHERALHIREAMSGAQSPELGESLTHLSRTWVSKGEFSKAQEMLERALRIREQNLGSQHVAVAETLMYLAMVKGLQMHLDEALATQARAVQIFDQAPDAPAIEHSMALTSYGVILGRNGEFAKGKPFIQRALLLQEGSLGPTHPIVARTLDSLAEFESKMGHPEEALPLAQRALQIREDRYGPDHPETAASLNTLGTLFWKQGDLQQAATSFQRALAMVEQSVGSVHPVVAANLLSLGEINRQMGNLSAAHEMFSRALDIQETTLGPRHNDVSISLNRMAWVASSQGDDDRAAVLLERAVSIREEALGGTHPDLALLLNDLARVKHRQGQLTKARPLYERARQIYLAASRLNRDLDDVTFSRLHQQGITSLQDYALLLAQISQTGPENSKDPSTVTDGFLVAEQARGWLVQAAVAKAMARKQAGHAGEVELAKHIDDLRRRSQELWGTLNGLYGQATQDASHLEKISVVKKEVQEVQQALEGELTKLEISFPKYAELAFPKPLDLHSVQELLEPGEALVSFYAWEQILQMWVVRPGQPPVSHTTQISKKDLTDLVTKVRASLTAKRVPFDVQGSHQLYRWLIEPVHTYLAEVQHLIIIPDEVLLPLPFGVLITDASGPAYARLVTLSTVEGFLRGTDMPLYTKVDWLIKRFSLTVVPSASAFRLLRQPVSSSYKDREPFIGFGDPIFSGKGQKRGGPMQATRNASMGFDQLRMMDALPGTRDELMAIAQILGVNPATNLFLRDRATETHVRHLLQEGRLGATQVVSFATHGLLAGQLSGLVEPALVLTIPERPTPTDDGLLTMGEILDFQLPQVDWVILSACNTAGNDGSGQGLTGLSRAFFFAGAKALLVSHWSVDDRATQALMTEIFGLFHQGKVFSKSAALREGMLAVMGQGMDGAFPYFSHPFAWAPFFVVGDGR